MYDFLFIYSKVSLFLKKKDWSGSVKELGLLEDIEPYDKLAIGKDPVSVNAWISSKV